MESEFSSGTAGDITVVEDAAAPSADGAGLTPVPEQAETYLTVSDYSDLAVSSVPSGALCGAIFMIVGLGIWVIVKIFKKA